LGKDIRQKGKGRAILDVSYFDSKEKRERRRGGKKKSGRPRMLTKRKSISNENNSRPSKEIIELGERERLSGLEGVRGWPRINSW